MKNIWLLFKKEILQALRDRRTALLVVIFPLIFYPLVLGIIYTYTSRSMQQASARSSLVLYVGSKSSPQLVDRFRKASDMKTAFYNDEGAARNDFNRGKGDLLVLASEEESGLNLNLKYRKWSRDSEIALTRVRNLLKTHLEETVRGKLSEMGLDYQNLSPPMRIEVENVGTRQSALGKEIVERMLPYFVVLAIITSAMGFGAEITAGEKERKTISTLLVSQLSRVEIVIGKFLAVVTVGTTAAILAVTGLVYGLGLFGIDMNMEGALDPGIAGGIFLTLLPLVGILSCIVIIVGSFARTQKEANIYQTPVYMLIILTGMLSMAGGIQLEGIKYLLPVVNSLELFKELIKGRVIMVHFLYTFLSNISLGIILLYISVRLFKRESIIFRT